MSGDFLLEDIWFFRHIFSYMISSLRKFHECFQLPEMGTVNLFRHPMTGNMSNEGILTSLMKLGRLLGFVAC